MRNYGRLPEDVMNDDEGVMETQSKKL